MDEYFPPFLFLVCFGSTQRKRKEGVDSVTDRLVNKGIARICNLIPIIIKY